VFWRAADNSYRSVSDFASPGLRDDRLVTERLAFLPSPTNTRPLHPK
jgi:hypothetical protein